MASLFSIAMVFVLTSSDGAVLGACLALAMATVLFIFYIVACIGNAVVASTITLTMAWPHNHLAFICTGVPQSSAGAGNYHVGSGVVSLSSGNVTVASSFASGQNWIFNWVSYGN